MQPKDMQSLIGEGLVIMLYRRRIWIMSVLATLMSFLYSFIGLGLSIARATGNASL